MNNHILQTIVNTMERMGLNNSTLAALVGTHRVYVSQVINGRRTPTLEWLQNVCEHLNLEIRLVEKPAKPRRRKAG